MFEYLTKKLNEHKRITRKSLNKYDLYKHTVSKAIEHLNHNYFELPDKEDIPYIVKHINNKGIKIITSDVKLNLLMSKSFSIPIIATNNTLTIQLSPSIIKVADVENNIVVYKNMIRNRYVEIPILAQDDNFILSNADHTIHTYVSEEIKGLIYGIRNNRQLL